MFADAEPPARCRSGRSPKLTRRTGSVNTVLAVSRAVCVAIVVASPLLLESRARTIEQMRLVNALCRFVDLAGTTQAT